MTTLQAQTGRAFQAMLKAWALHAGSPSGQGRQVAEDPIFAVLDKITSPRFARFWRERTAAQRHSV